MINHVTTLFVEHVLSYVRLCSWLRTTTVVSHQKLVSIDLPMIWRVKENCENDGKGWKEIGDFGLTCPNLIRVNYFGIEIPFRIPLPTPPCQNISLVVFIYFFTEALKSYPSDWCVCDVDSPMFKMSHLSLKYYCSLL